MDGTRPLLVLSLVVSVALAGCPSLPGVGGGPGAKHEAYLTGGGVLVVELDHAPGQGPTPGIRSALESELERITRKTVEVQVSQQLPAGGSQRVYDEGELRDMHEQFQDEEDRSGVVVMHMMFVDGRIRSDGSTNIAGLAFASEGVALAMATLRENTCPDGSLTCLGEPEFTNAVRAVAIHEAGHLLGLVDLGLPMVRDHEDDEHPGHSTNDRSVMWWEVEVGTRLSNLFTRGSDIPWQFDSNDIADARAIQT